MAITVLAALMSVLPASAADAAPSGFLIVAPGSDKCLDVPGNSGQVGVDLTIYTCHGAGSQRFAKRGNDIEHVSSGLCLGYEDRTGRSGDVELRPCGEAGPTFTFQDLGFGETRIKALHPNPDKCLDRAASGLTNGTPVVFWGCHSGANQRWRIVTNLSFTIGVSSINRCLDAPAPATIGTDLILYDCHGGSTQRFVEQGTEIVHVESGLCLGYQGGTSGQGRHVELRDCQEAGPDFVWELNGSAMSIKARQPSTDLCIDREGGGSANYTAIIYWGCHGGGNQLWTRQIHETSTSATYVTHHGAIYTTSTSQAIDQGVTMEWWVRVQWPESNDANRCNGRGFADCVYFPMMTINLDGPGSGTHIGPQLANQVSDQFGQQWIINYGTFTNGVGLRRQWTGTVPTDSWIRFRFVRDGSALVNGEWWSDWQVRALINGVERVIDTVGLRGRYITSAGMAYESIEFGGDACVSSAPNVEYRVDRYQVQTGTNSYAWRDFYGVKANYSGEGGTPDAACPRDEFRTFSHPEGHFQVERYGPDTSRAVPQGSWIVVRP